LRKDSCVLATTDGETPHCSLMAYVPDDSGERLFLITSSASRKYQNIRRHPRVSLLIDTRGEQQRKFTQALTVTGTADILQDTGEIAQVKATFVRQHPDLAGFIRKDEMAVICVQVGGGSSERQWNDVLGVLQAQKEKLDYSCLQQGARKMGVAALSKQAIEDAAETES